MKEILRTLAAIILFAAFGNAASAQCLFTTAYGSATISSSNILVPIASCGWDGEYSTINGAVPGQTLQFNRTGGGYVKIRSGAPGGPVIAAGMMPLSFVNTFAGTLYAHWSLDNNCNAFPGYSCRATTVQHTSAPSPIPNASAPIAICQNATVQLDANGITRVDAAQVNDGSTASNGIVSMTVSPSGFSCADIGSNTVVLTIMDNVGNTATCTAIVTVADIIAPYIECNLQGVITGPNSSNFDGDVTLSNDFGQCGALFEYSNDFVDNCGNPIETQTAGLPSGSLFPVGTTLNTYVVTDQSGNTASCSFNVTVIDIENPTIICNPGGGNIDPNTGLPSGGNTELANDAGLCSAIYVFSNLAQDNCGISTLVQSAGLPSGSIFPVGTTTNTFVATDLGGNTASCSFTVAVLDIERPTITCPPNAVVTTYMFAYPIFADNCPQVTTAQTAGFPSGSNVGSGIVENTFVATDASGNTASCSFTIETVDEPCSLDSFRLQSTDFSFEINKCVGPGINGQLIPCTVQQPAWGTVVNRSTSTNLQLEVTLATGWYCDFAQYIATSPNNLLIDGNTGFPSIGTDWSSEVINPLRNQFIIDVPLYGQRCVDFAMRLSILRIRINGSPNNATRTSTWLYNDEWNDPNSAFQSNNAYTLRICPTTNAVVPTLLSCNEQVIGDNHCAEPVAPPFCGFAAIGQGLWYNFVGTGRFVSVSTVSPNTFLDTQISVFEGSDINNLVCVGSNDNANYPNNPNASEFGWTTTVGTQYWILVSGAYSGLGQFELSIKADPVANDDRCNAVPLQAGVALPFDNLCTTIEPNEVVPPGGDCNGQLSWCDNMIDNTVWFSFQAPATGCVSLLVDNMQGTAGIPNFQIAVYEAPNCGDFANFSLLAANDDGGPALAPVITAINCLRPGQTYYVQVDGYNGFQGLGDITLSECTGHPAIPAFSTVPIAINNVVNACLGQEIYFQDNSSGVVGWLWEFGDGFVSTAMSPSHAYQLPGNFTVQLTVSDICGSTQALSANIAVSAEPAPEIFCASIVCQGDTARYTTNAVCTTYQWQVDGGNIVSQLLNNDTILVVWGSGNNGFGTVSLSVPNCGALCDNPAIKVVPILPTSLAIAGPTLVCSGNASTYTVPNIPGTVYTWSVGSLGFIAAGQGTHTVQIVWDPNAVGMAQIQLSYQNDIAGCAGAGSYDVQLLQRFQVTGPQTACEGVANTLTPFTAQQLLGNVAVPCNWSVTTPSALVLPNLASNTATFTYDFSAGGGQYILTATPSNGNFCNATAAAVVMVTATPPVPAAITGVLLICPGNTYAYNTATMAANLQWSATGGTVAGVGNAVDVTWDAIGPYQLSVFQISNDSDACSSAVRTLDVIPYPTPALPTLTGQGEICLGASANYNFAGPLVPAATYTWSIDPPQAGSITAGQGSNNIAVQWTANGNVATTAQVILQVGLCGTQTTSFPVTLHAHPEPVITAPLTSCTGAPVNFIDNGQSGDTYAWLFGDGNTALTHNPTHIYPSAGSYATSLTVTSPQGCAGSTNLPITVLPIPATPVVAGPTTVCAGATSNYAFSPSLAGINYSWSVSPALWITTPVTSNAVAVAWSNVASPTMADIVLHLASQCLSTDVHSPVQILPLPAPTISGPTSLCIGGTAQFADNGAATDAYFWTFGDGGVSTAHNPAHTYNVPGNYTVTLTLTTAQQCMGVGTWNIVVHALPTLVMTSPASACAGASVTFADNGQLGDQYSWTFGDGATASIHNPTHVYAAAGTYNVSLQLTNANGCATTRTSNIVVDQVPSIPTVTGAASVCGGNASAYTFAPISPDAVYTWSVTPSLASGSAPAANANPALFAWNVVASPTMADIVLHVSSTCLSTDKHSPITVQPLPSPTIGGPSTICSGVTAQFTDNAILGESLAWDFGDGSTSNATDPQHTYAVAGDYIVTLVLTNVQGCTATSTFQIHVLETPAVPVITGAQMVCARENTLYAFAPFSTAATYAWSVSPASAATGIVSAGPHAVRVIWDAVTVSTQADVVLSVVSACDTMTILHPVTIHPLPAAATAPHTTICAGTSMVIGTLGVPGNTYIWTPALGLNNATISDPVASPTTATTYNLTETITATGCSRSNPVTLVVVDLPAANAGLDQVICSGAFATLGAPAVAGNSYVWSPTTGLSAATAASPIANPTATTVYTVTETNTNTGCQQSNAVTVTVNATPSPVIGFSSPVCLGISTTFTASLGSSWFWDFGDGDTSTLHNPMHTFASVGTETITVTATSDSGCVATASAIVNIAPVPAAEIHIAQSSSLCIGDTISVTLQQDIVSTGYTYAWQPGTFSTSNPTTVTNTGDYSLLVTNHFGCSATSNTIKISEHVCVPPCPCGTPGCGICGPPFECVLEPYTLSFASAIVGCSTRVFSSTSSGSISALTWNFGDNQSSIAPSPTHTYAQPGNYGVVLYGNVNGTITPGGGACSTAVSVSAVTPIPLIADFFTEFRCNGTGQIETQFRDLSRYILGNDIDDWDWDFGDGSPHGAGMAPLHVYASPGLHNVTLTITSAAPGATCAITLPVVTPAPAMAAFTPPSAVCQGSLVTFANASSGQIISSLWDFDVADPTSPTSNLLQPTATYNAAGNYVATLSATDAYGCTSFASQPITILPVNVGVITGGPLSFCQGGSVTLTGPVGASWLWSPGNETTQNIVVTQSGSYQVVVTQPNGCSYQTAPVQVAANALPNVQTGGAVAICNGNSVQIGSNGTSGMGYVWTPSTGLSDANVSNPFANPITTTSYTLTATENRTGCQASESVTVTVHPKPDADAGNGGVICATGSLQIGAATVPGNTYLWNPATGLSAANAANPLASPVATTTYTLTEMVTATGCQQSNKVTIAVNAIPTAHVGNPTAICTGANVLLGGGATSGNTYIWSPATGLSATTVANPIANPSSSTTYTLTETVSSTGCQNSNSVTVLVNPLPAANAGLNAIICRGIGTALGAPPVPGNTYTWFPTTGLSAANIANPIASPTATTTYTLIETVTATGCQRSSSVTVTVNPLPSGNAGSDISICNGDSTNIGTVAVMANAYSWTPSTGLSAANLANLVAHPTVTTTYSLMETVLATGCEQVSSVTVTVNPLPLANVGANHTICLGTGTVLGAPTLPGNSYTWSPLIGLNAANIAQPTASPSSTTTYQLTETVNATGCQATQAVTVSVEPLPFANVGSDVTICAGASAGIGGVAIPGHTYSWTPATGLSAANSANPVASPTATTIYTLVETDLQTGCQNTNAVTITVRPLPLAILGNTTAICLGDQVTLGSSNTSGNTYIWSPTAGLNAASISNPTASPLVTTVYSMTETNVATGCTNANSVTVTVNPIPDAVVGSNNHLCLGESTQLGGVPVSGNTYLWHPSNGLNQANISNPTATPSVSTTYELTETIAATGCAATESVNVTVNPLPSTVINGTANYCSGDTLMLNATPGFVYDWSWDELPIDGGYNPLGVADDHLTFEVTEANAGNYTVLVSDPQTGCSNLSVPFGVTINPLPSAPLIAANGSEPLCNNQTWTLAVTNITSGIDYLWNTGQVGPSIVAVEAGTYSVIAINAYGCATASNEIIVRPTPDIAGIPSGCYDYCETLAPLEVVGPSGYAQYAWILAPGQTVVSTLQNLTVSTSGSYQLQVTNAEGCAAISDFLDITFIDCCTTFVATTTTTDLNCFESSDGSVSVNALGGLQPYIYQWNTGGNGTEIQGLAAGISAVNVYDQNNCLLTIQDTVMQPDLLEISVVEASILCHGDSAMVVISATGGTAPYVGIGTQTFAAGSYQVTVTDAHGCTAIWDGFLTEPDALSASGTAGAIQCQGDSTVATVTATGGTEPYIGTGSFAVSNGTNVFVVTDANGCTSATTIIVSPVSTLEASASAGTILCNGSTTTVVIGAMGGNPPYAGVGSFVVGAGTHTFLVLDANLCTDTILIVVEEPTALSANAITSTISCNGGSASVTVTASGGTAPYSGVGTFVVIAGTYSYLVTDANGCTASTNITVAEPTSLLANATAGTIACAGGSTNVVVTASGGTAPYSGVGTFAVTAGAYTYLVTDANGCIATVNITIAQPIPLLANATAGTIACAGGSTNVVVTASGGTAPYAGVGTFSASAGSRSYTVTDANGCTATATIVVTTALDVTPPTIICPTNMTVAAPSGQCSTAVSFGVIATDNCGAASVVVNPASGSVFAVGTSIVTATATDIAGNAVTCSFTVTVSSTGGGVTWTGIPANIALVCGSAIPDVPAIVPCGVVVGCPPIAVCYPNFTHLGDNGGSRYYRADVSGSWTQARSAALSIGGSLATIDNVGENTYLNNLIGGASLFWIGLNDATTEGSYAWTSGSTAAYRNWATGQPDNLGNQDFVAWNSNTGKWEDRSATDSYKALVEVNCGVTPGVSAVNACGPCPTVTMAQTTVPGTCAGRYTIVRTWTASSAIGAVLGTTSQTITVSDNIAPILTCPGNITVSTNPGAGTAIATFVATATDNCSGATVMTVPASGSAFAVGITAVVATATDGCGNSSTCTFNVTVNAVPLSYCTAAGLNASAEWISRVQIGTIDNNTTANGGYADFTTLSTTVTRSNSYAMNLRAGYATTQYVEYWSVYADWNRDGDFTDAGELGLQVSGAGIVAGTLTIPATAALGSTRMRVLMSRTCYVSGPCGTFASGEVEDYTLNVTGGNVRIAAASGEAGSDVATVDPAKSLVLIEVYPVPTMTEVKVDFLALLAGRVRVQVLALDGKVIMDTQRDVLDGRNTVTMDVSGLAAGNYYVRISDGNGALVGRFVKE